jgi:hypothetical protein
MRKRTIVMSDEESDDGVEAAAGSDAAEPAATNERAAAPPIAFRIARRTADEGVASRSENGDAAAAKNPRVYSKSQKKKRAQRMHHIFDRRGRFLDEQGAAIQRRQADFDRSVHEFENQVAAQVSCTWTPALHFAPATFTCMMSTDFATRMQAEPEEGEIVEKLEFVKQPSSKSREKFQLERSQFELERTRRNMAQLAAEAHASSIDCERAKRKARELERDVKRCEEEINRRQRKIIRIAGQRDQIHHEARRMFMASVQVVRMPDDGARQDELAARSKKLRDMHKRAVFAHHGPGGRLPPKDGVW